MRMLLSSPSAIVRLNTKGFSQVEKVDFRGMFRPNPPPASIKLVAGIAIEAGKEYFHLDVTQVFVVRPSKKRSA